VKLYVQEEHSSRVRDFVNNHPKPFQTTSLCFAEAISVLKRKWMKKELSIADYLEAIRRITVDGWGRAIDVEDFGLFDPFKQKDLERLVTDYGIDLSDALQLLTILYGKYSVLTGESKSVLVTADFGLAEPGPINAIRSGCFPTTASFYSARNLAVVNSRDQPPSALIHYHQCH